MPKSLTEKFWIAIAQASPAFWTIVARGPECQAAFYDDAPDIPLTERPLERPNLQLKSWVSE